MRANIIAAFLAVVVLIVIGCAAQKPVPAPHHGRHHGHKRTQRVTTDTHSHDDIYVDAYWKGWSDQQTLPKPTPIPEAKPKPTPKLYSF